MARNHAAEVAAAEEYDTPLPIPPKSSRKKGDPFDREWRFQAACVLKIKRAMRTDPDLEYLATLAEGQRDPARAAVAQMMGLKSGPSDLLLFRRTDRGLKLAWVELKLPGKPLSKPQRDWHAWFTPAGVECHRCDNIQDFERILAAF